MRVLRLSGRWLAILSLVVMHGVLAKLKDKHQPRVTTIESFPARKVAGIIALPDGSPWCRGHPTVWLPGHKANDDAPNCLVKGKWARPNYAILDNNDDLNDIDGPEVIDRHDCGALDVNDDGRLDLYCTVGANSGTGYGYNELYLTRKDGSLRKVKKHGLQRFPGMRTRYTTVLRDINGTEMAFIATIGIQREDGEKNTHRMFKKTGKSHTNTKKSFFNRLKGPWRTHSYATCAVTADVNRDGIDDLIVCNFREYAYVYLQSKDGGFRRYPWLASKNQKHWRNIRVADFSGDGIPELAVLYWGDKKTGKLKIFRGTRNPPYFDFTGPVYYERTFPHSVVDLEVLDVQEDGLLDLYIVLSDENVRDKNGKLRKSYCAGKFNHRDWWSKGNQPPNNFRPPFDRARDILLIGRRPGKFKRIKMNHREPGCGNLVRAFGNKTLVLSQGNFVRPGHNLVLDW